MNETIIKRNSSEFFPYYDGQNNLVMRKHSLKGVCEFKQDK